MGDVKPAADGAPLNIKIQDQTGMITEFKIKSSTKLSKIFGVYCEKKGDDPASIRFLFDGHHLVADKTVGEYDIEDGDTIDAVQAQVGGRVAPLLR